MKHNYHHNHSEQDGENHEKDFFREADIPYRKTREEAWSELEARIGREQVTRKTFTLRPHRLSLGIAAAILLLAGVFSILRFYTVTVNSPAGQHVSHILPDGSKVELNAGSGMSYKIFWWRFQRQITFEGEGYFEVEKGKKFEVVSGMGRTEVLGTSFNIYSRANEYHVSCITGQVKVISATSREVVLTPDYTASIGPGGHITVVKETAGSQTYSWINNMFNFTSKPLSVVLEEIGRQYGVTVTLESQSDPLYTGYFSRNKPVEAILELVCKPFGLIFARVSAKEYKVFQNQDM